MGDKADKEELIADIEVLPLPPHVEEVPAIEDAPGDDDEEDDMWRELLEHWKSSAMLCHFCCRSLLAFDNLQE